MNRRPVVTPDYHTKSGAYRADRRQDPSPIYREGQEADKAFDGADDRIVPETGPWGAARRRTSSRVRGEDPLDVASAEQVIVRPMRVRRAFLERIVGIRDRVCETTQNILTAAVSRDESRSILSCHENVNGSHTRRCYRVKH